MLLYNYHLQHSVKFFPIYVMDTICSLSCCIFSQQLISKCLLFLSIQTYFIPMGSQSLKIFFLRVPLILTLNSLLTRGTLGWFASTISDWEFGKEQTSAKTHHYMFLTFPFLFSIPQYIVVLTNITLYSTLQLKKVTVLFFMPIFEGL